MNQDMKQLRTLDLAAVSSVERQAFALVVVEVGHADHVVAPAGGDLPGSMVLTGGQRLLSQSGLGSCSRLRVASIRQRVHLPAQ